MKMIEILLIGIFALALIGCAAKADMDFICSQSLSNLPESGVITTNMSRTTDGKYTNSMYPTFTENSKLTLERVHPDTNLYIGDIIEFKVPKEFGCIIIHRIVKKGIDNNGVYYITKGDNNFLADSSFLTGLNPIRQEDVLYKITKID